MCACVCLWKREEELISDVFLWTPTHEYIMPANQQRLSLTLRIPETV